MTTWTITVPAPHVKPVVKRKTGKVFKRQPFLNSSRKSPDSRGFYGIIETAPKSAGHTFRGLTRYLVLAERG